MKGPATAAEWQKRSESLRVHAENFRKAGKENRAKEFDDAADQARQIADSMGFRPMVPGDGRTHCRYGHEFTEENTFISKAGRICKTCKRTRAKKYKNRSLHEQKDT
jgi:hypothetical protein